MKAKRSQFVYLMRSVRRLSFGHSDLVTEWHFHSDLVTGLLSQCLKVMGHHSPAK